MMQPLSDEELEELRVLMLLVKNAKETPEERQRFRDLYGRWLLTRDV